MLPSHAGSAPAGHGAASGRGNTGHGPGAVGSGIRPVLVRTGQNIAAVSGSSGVVGRQGDGVGMLGGNGQGVVPRGGARPGNGTGLTTLQTSGQGAMGVLNTGIGIHGGSRFNTEKDCAPMCSGSDADSESGEDDDPMGSIGDSRRGVKRERAEMEATVMGHELGVQPGGFGGVPGGVAGAKPGKKTRGRVKIKMEFIDNKLRRYTTFSKRKTGIMKKAYELSTLTGTQVLLLVASETGHVYTFATRKLQPMITSETGKALIQTCLNSPDSPPRSDPSTDQRMSATGFEETDLTYQVSESESMGDSKVSSRERQQREAAERGSRERQQREAAESGSRERQQRAAAERGSRERQQREAALDGGNKQLYDQLKPAFTVTSLPGTTSSPTAPSSSTSMQVTSGTSFPITNYLAPPSSNASANGSILKATSTTAGVMQLPGGFTFMSAGTALPPGTPTIPLSQLQQHPLTLQAQALCSSQHAHHSQQAVFRFPAAVSLTGTGMQQHLQPSSNSTNDSNAEMTLTSTTTVSLPATIVTSSVPTSMAGHMMYPSPHAVMYTSTPALGDGSLAVLNTFSPGAMQVAPAPGHDAGAVPQVFLTAPPGTVQIPVSAVQLHPVRQDLHLTNGDWSAAERRRQHPDRAAGRQPGRHTEL
ncbi:serum response factor b isoform X2 [Osmerus mordax]|uniref:serum response factor b isoform X2 n=1 Tax=Osmerus mordax TaxID=8014 RepID=UPI00351013F2